VVDVPPIRAGVLTAQPHLTHLCKRKQQQVCIIRPVRPRERVVDTCVSRLLTRQTKAHVRAQHTHTHTHTMGSSAAARTRATMASDAYDPRWPRADLVLQ
jgi:hypothetical protein